MHCHLAKLLLNQLDLEVSSNPPSKTRGKNKLRPGEFG
jgi:hypothetical protein